MDAPPDNPIHAGKLHRTSRDVEMLVYDYDEMCVKTEVLPAGSIFQPWEPLAHWRGSRVPITLGEGAAEFDWGVSSPTGHFLKWDDFFTLCRMCEPESEERGPLREETLERPPATEASAPTKATLPAMTPTRCWKLPDGHYLLEGAEQHWPVNTPSSIRLPNGEVLSHATEFRVVTREGKLVTTYPPPRAYSLEDTLYIYDIHVVSGGQLYRYFWQQPWRYEEMIEAQCVLTGLVECAADALPFDPARTLSK